MMKRIVRLKSSLTGGPYSVACLVIGDEILSGKTLDSNSNFLAKKCFGMGLEVRRIVVVPDVESDIISQVRSLSQSHDFVFTSGGIGPTHDDITYDSISKAFGLSLKIHDQTVARMKLIASAKLKAGETFEMTPARSRMALLPFNSLVPSQVSVSFPVPGFWVPIVTIETRWGTHVSILPGIPKLFTDLVDAYLTSTVSPLLPPIHGFIRLQVGTSLPESEIANILTDVQETVSSLGIKIGSYPHWQSIDSVDSNGNKVQERVVISIVGKDPNAVKLTAESIKSQIQGWFIAL